VARLARLAVDEAHQGNGYGELLLVDALYRTSTAGENIGIHGMIIDAKYEKASQFYKKYGFHSFSNNSLTLFSSLKDLRGKFTS
jgi:GNAT superfamily N-acetyltransferase